MCDMIKPIFIPPPSIRHLRDLLRFRMKLTYQITGMKNRALNCLTISNLKLDDVFGKSSRSIIQQILDNPGIQFDVPPYVDKQCKHPIEEIQDAIDGAICPEQATKLKICLDFIDEQEKRISKLDAEIFRLVEPYTSVLKFMRTVPGFSKKPLTAIRLLSEIGPDMSVFPTSKNLVLWAGCCPRNDSNAQKVKSTHISCEVSYL